MNATILVFLNWLTLLAAVLGAGYLIRGWQGAIIALCIFEGLKFLINVPDFFKNSKPL